MPRPLKYVQHPGLSQSDLKDFEDGILEFYHSFVLGERQDDTDQSEAMDVGTIIHAILLGDKEDMNKFYVCTALKATGKIKDCVDTAMRIIDNQLREEAKGQNTSVELEDYSTLAMWEECIEKAIEVHEFQTNWKMDTRVKKVITEGSEYYAQLLEASGKYMVSLEAWNKAHTIVNDMKEDPSTKRFLDLVKDGDPSGRMVVVKEKEQYGDYDSIPLKGIPDVLFIDTIARTVECWDVKTSKTHGQFKINYKKERYGRQQAFYRHLISQNYPGYNQETPCFMVIPTAPKKNGVYTEKPEIYKMSMADISIYTSGSTTESGYRYWGWQELVREYQWHKEYGKWEHKREYYDRGYNKIDIGIAIESAEEELTAATEIF